MKRCAGDAETNIKLYSLVKCLHFKQKMLDGFYS